MVLLLALVAVGPVVSWSPQESGRRLQQGFRVGIVAGVARKERSHHQKDVYWDWAGQEIDWRGAMANERSFSLQAVRGLSRETSQKLLFAGQAKTRLDCCSSMS